MKNQRTEIINVARVLFLEQGYSKTTILQIAQASGYQTGSIYHFFKNKEELFMAAVLEREIELRDNIFSYYAQKGKKVDGVYAYSVICFLILYTSEHYANLLDYHWNSYRLGSIMGGIAKQTTERNLEWFCSEEHTMTYTQMYLTTMAMCGVIYSFLTDMRNRHYVPFRSRVRSYLEIALRNYGVAADKVAFMTSDCTLDDLECEVADILDRFNSDSVLSLSLQKQRGRNGRPGGAAGRAEV